MNQLVIIGCGSFGREVADVVTAINAQAPTFELVGFVDHSPSLDDVKRIGSFGISFVGTVRDAIAGPPRLYYLAIGSYAVRRLLALQLYAAGWTAPVLVHPQASVCADVVLGPGTVLCAGVRLSTSMRLGRRVHVNLNSTLGHDHSLLAFATVNRLVAVSGGVQIGEATMLGTHPAVLHNAQTKLDPVVGGSALVTRDIANGCVVKGGPSPMKSSRRAMGSRKYRSRWHPGLPSRQAPLVRTHSRWFSPERGMNACG